MQCFPTLDTPSGAFAIPLSGHAAEWILQALVARRSKDAQRAALSRALRRDGPFALWVVCRAAACGESSLRTTDQSAAWLADTIGQEFAGISGHHGDNGALSDPVSGTARPPRPGAAERRWADSASRSYGIARLAAQLAIHASLDGDEAHLAGLLHAAPDWLHAARRDARDNGPETRSRASRGEPKRRTARPSRGKTASGIEPPALAGVLPEWLQRVLDEAASSDARHLSCVADCLAVAVQIDAGRRVPRGVTSGFRFNRRAHQREVAAARRGWLGESSIGAALPALAADLERLRTLDGQFQQTLENEKLDSLKELAYGAGHEINNPLAKISARAQTLLQQERDPQRRRLLAAINTQAFRAHEMISDMMLFARPPQPQPADVDLAALLRSVVDELTTQAAAQDTQLDYQAPRQPIVARVDATQIGVAAKALCANALEALGRGGRVEVAIRQVDQGLCPSPADADSSQPAKSRAPGETVQITVADNGPGISSEVRRHIFDPFYSGREAGRGLGFGLSKCWRIVGMHGGSVEVDSTPDGGATFTITLPVAGVV